MKQTQVDKTLRLASVHTNGIDWETRTVWIIGALDEMKAYQYLPGLRLLDETPGLIHVMIMTPGGAEAGGFAIYDTLRTMKNEVWTYGFGEVCSIGALIFQAGSKRFMSHNCELMMHNGTVNLGKDEDVDTDTIEELAKEAVRNNARYHRAIALRCGIPQRVVSDWCRVERYFGAHEARENKLVDEVLKEKGRE